MVETFEIKERTTPRYLATLVDEDEVTMIPGSALTTLVGTLYAFVAGVPTIVNGRNKQNVLNMNGVTVYDTLQTDAAGHTYNLLYRLSVADTTLLTTLPFEKHTMLFEYTAYGGTLAGKHRVIFNIENLTLVP